MSLQKNPKISVTDDDLSWKPSWSAGKQRNLGFSSCLVACAREKGRVRGKRAGETCIYRHALQLSGEIYCILQQQLTFHYSDYF